MPSADLAPRLGPDGLALESLRFAGSQRLLQLEGSVAEPSGRAVVERYPEPDDRLQLRSKLERPLMFLGGGQRLPGISG